MLALSRLSKLFLPLMALLLSGVWLVGGSAAHPAPDSADRTLAPAPAGPLSPAATPTACPIQFTDVPPQSPYYAYIRCLACRGVAEGYCDLTFRPDTDLSRGALAQWISQAVGYNDVIPSTQQTFTDVPPGSYYWVYIERVALHGVMDGYTTNPPCTGGPPCFLPENGVTRAQAAKVVATAANYAEVIPSTQRHFEDVTNTDPFWVYIERMALHNGINAYGCNIPPAGPCVPPGNRPYFVGGANIIRGDAAQWIAQTFFPNCQTPANRPVPAAPACEPEPVGPSPTPAPPSPTPTVPPSATPTSTATSTLPLGASPTATATPGCGLAWNVVSSPNVGTANNYLYSVSVRATDDVWAVGSYTLDTVSYFPLTEHWDGTQWTVIPSLQAGTTSGLRAVVARTSGDVWAIGSYNVSNGPNQTLIEHWNGTAWSIVASPNPGSTENDLFGVTALAPNDAWAVGSFTNGSGQTLVEHWDGSQWSVVPSANPGSAQGFGGIAAAAANDIWAVGSVANGGPAQPLLEHWNGSAWSVATTPNVGPGTNLLSSVAVVTANDVWAVGTANYALFSTGQPLTMHWDGTQWTVVSSPVPGPFDSYLQGVTVRAPNDVWASGYYEPGSPYNYQPLAMHWNGTAWSLSLPPSITTNATYLYGIGAIPNGDLLAVGSYLSQPGAGQHTLVERYHDPCLSPTPAPPTATTTPTATVCPVQFTDVDTGNPFYAYIRCLACRSIVSGYSTSPPCAVAPCFAPGSSVTRGQTAKFVANAANYQDAIPSTQQTFTDVPPSSPFWVYIERAYQHGVISGYSSSPPCTTGVPCFLPGNAVTRGQTAKFVSQAAGYSDPIPSTRQTFSDVPYSSPFWVYVERAVAHGVISGYSTNPPCVTGVPCFLGGNPVTRGQTAKFIANAFFPNCQTPAR